MQLVDRILENKAMCLICGKVVYSPGIHISQTCECGNLTVDGGTAYLKRSFKHRGKWKEMSIYEGDNHEAK